MPVAQKNHMHLSVPVIEDGALIAVAAQRDVGGDSGWFPIAIDARLEELDRSNFVSPAAIEQVARGYLRRNHPVAAPSWK